ncbi:S-adenosylmethionine synthetase [Lactococcus lactis subsp. lactis]|nr:S-adenosylmethionine synthetase [Lactococcus lactis subsp. lactis]
MSPPLSFLANGLNPKVERHFGSTDVELPWEQTDKVEELKTALKK